jgi:hypothetical protein
MYGPGGCQLGSQQMATRQAQRPATPRTVIRQVEIIRLRPRHEVSRRPDLVPEPPPIDPDGEAGRGRFGDCY